MKNIYFNKQWKYLVQAAAGLAVLFLAACAASPSSQSEVSQIVQQKVASEHVEKIDQVLQTLPLQALDQDVLEQLMTVNFASYQGDWVLAAVSAAKAAVVSRDHRLAQLATALAIKAGDESAAYEMSQLWYELQPESEEAKNAALITLVTAGEIARAQAAFDKLLRDDVSNGIKQIAGLLLKQTNVDATMQILQVIVDDYPNTADVFLSAAYVASVFMEHDKEALWINQALVLDSSSEAAVKLKINLLESQGKSEERQRVISEFLTSHPKAVQIRLSQARDFSKQGDYKQALSITEQVLSDDSGNLVALAFAASLAEHLQKVKQARSFYLKFLQLNPKDDRTRWSLARLEVEQKNYQKAERLYAQIQDESLWFGAQLQVAEMRYELNGIQSALKHLNRLTPETHKQYVDQIITRHYLLFGEALYDDALGYINEAILLMPSEQQFVYARALVAAELSQVDLAESDLRSIIAQQPDHANALNALGYTLADQTQRYDEAKKLVSQALALRPNDGHILDSMGWVLYRMQEFPQAIDYMRKAYETSQDAEVAAHLGEVLWEGGQQEEAKMIWNGALTEDSAHPILNETMQRYGVKP